MDEEADFGPRGCGDCELSGSSAVQEGEHRFCGWGTEAEVLGQIKRGLRIADMA